MNENGILQTYPEVNQYYDYQRAFESPSDYILANEDSGWRIETASEILEEIDVAKITMGAESFDFLRDSEEEGYTLDDGKPLC